MGGRSSTVAVSAAFVFCSPLPFLGLACCRLPSVFARPRAFGEETAAFSAAAGRAAERGGTYSGSFFYQPTAGEPRVGYGSFSLDGVASYQPYLLAAASRSTSRWSVRDVKLLDQSGQVAKRIADSSGLFLNQLRVPAT